MLGRIERRGGGRDTEREEGGGRARGKEKKQKKQSDTATQEASGEWWEAAIQSSLVSSQSARAKPVDESDEADQSRETDTFASAEEIEQWPWLLYSCGADSVVYEANPVAGCGAGGARGGSGGAPGRSIDIDEYIRMANPQIGESVFVRSIFCVWCVFFVRVRWSCGLVHSQRRKDCS